MGEYSQIAPNSVVPPNRIIPDKEIWGGSPARFIRKMRKEDVFGL